MKTAMFFALAAWIFVYAQDAPAPSPAGADTASSESAPSSLALLEQYLGDREEFERRVRAFDKLHVAIARAQYVEARTLEQQGDASGARAASDRARENLQQVKNAYDMGLARFDNSPILHNFYAELIHDFFGRIHEASKHWHRAVQLDPKYARAHNNLGMYYCHAGMYAMGVDSLDNSLRLEPNNPDFLFNMTQIYLTHYPHVMQIRQWTREQVYREAMKLSERAVKFAPADFEVLRDHALNYFLAGNFGVKADWRKAAQAWQATRPYARTDAERFNTWLNEARVHLRNNDRRRANECLEAARAIWPDSPVVQQLLEDFAE